MMRWIFLSLMGISYAMTLCAYVLLFKRFRSLEAFSRDAVVFCSVLAFGQIQVICLLLQNHLFPFYESQNFLTDKIWLFWAGAFVSFAPWMSSWTFFENRRARKIGYFLTTFIMSSACAIGVAFGAFGPARPDLLGLSILGGWKTLIFALVLWHAVTTKFYAQTLMLQFLIPMGIFTLYSGCKSILGKSAAWDIAEIFAAFSIHLFVSVRLGYECVKVTGRRQDRHAYVRTRESESDTESFYMDTPLLTGLKQQHHNYRPANFSPGDEELAHPESDTKDSEPDSDSLLEAKLSRMRAKMCISSADIPYLADSDVDVFDPRVHAEFPDDVPEATKLVLKTAGIKKKIAETNRELTFEALKSFRIKSKMAKERNDDGELVDAVNELRQIFVEAGLDVVKEHNLSVRILDFLPPPRTDNIFLDPPLVPSTADAHSESENDVVDVDVGNAEVQSSSDEEFVSKLLSFKRVPHFITMNLLRRESAPLTVKSLSHTSFSARLTTEKLLQLRVTFPLDFCHSGGTFMAPQDSTPIDLKIHMAIEIRRNGLVKSSKSQDVDSCDLYLKDIGKLPEDQMFKHIPGLESSKICDLELRSREVPRADSETVRIEFPASWKLPIRDFLVKHTDTASDVLILLSEEVQRRANWDTFSLFIDQEALDPSQCVLMNVKKAGGVALKLAKTNPKRASKSVRIRTKDLLPQRHVDGDRKVASVENVLSMIENKEGAKKHFVKITVSSEIPHKGDYEGPVAPVAFMIQSDWRPPDVAKELKKRLAKKRIFLNYVGFRSRLFLANGTELKNRAHLKSEIRKVTEGPLCLEFKPTRAGSSDEYSMSSESVEYEDDDDDDGDSGRGNSVTPNATKFLRVTLSDSLRKANNFKMSALTIDVSAKTEIADVIQKIAARVDAKEQSPLIDEEVGLYLPHSEIEINSRRQLVGALLTNPNPLEMELRMRPVEKKNKKKLPARLLRVEISESILPDACRYTILVPDGAGKAVVVKMIQDKMPVDEAKTIKASEISLILRADGTEIRNKSQFEKMFASKNDIPMVLLERKAKP